MAVSRKRICWRHSCRRVCSMRACSVLASRCPAAERNPHRMMLSIEVKTRCHAFKCCPAIPSEDVDVQETQDYDVVVVGCRMLGHQYRRACCAGGLRGRHRGENLPSWRRKPLKSGLRLRLFRTALSLKAAGVTTDTEPIIQSWIADSHWRVDAAAIRQLVNSSSAAVDWMAELGWNFTYLGMGADITALLEYDERGPLFDAMVEGGIRQT